MEFLFDLFVYCCGFIQGMQSKHRGSRQQETGRRSWRWFVVVVILPILFGVMKMTKKEPIMGKLEAPTGPNENELNEVAEFEQNKKMTNVKYMSRCQALDNVDIAQYENKVERLGKVLNLPEAEIEELKSARYSDKEVNALEKFDLGLDGIFYFGKFTTKKRHDGNMDLAIVLYALRWNLADQVEKSWFKGDILLLQSIHCKYLGKGAQKKRKKGGLFPKPPRPPPPPPVWHFHEKYKISMCFLAIFDPF